MFWTSFDLKCIAYWKTYVAWPTGISRAMFSMANACILCGPSAWWEHCMLCVCHSALCLFLLSHKHIHNPWKSKISCQNDSVECINVHRTQPLMLLLYCCSFLLWRVVHVMQGCCLRKFSLFMKGDLTMLCVWFYWISQCMIREM